MKIDILGVQAFISIANMGTFQRAAASLNLSQTALSHRLRKFEEDLGFQLLTRTTRKVALTPAGQFFAPKARRFMADAESALGELRAVGTRKQDVVAAGCLPTVAATVLPPILQEFATKHTSITIRIVDRIAPDLIELVRLGDVEVALTFASATVPELEFKPLIKQQFVALCPSDHPLSRRATLSASNLVEASLIRLGPNDAGRILIDDAMGRRGRRLSWSYEVQQMTTAIALVESGIGIAIVPRLSVDPEKLWNSVVIPLVDPRITGTFGLLTRRNVPLSPAADALIAAIRKKVASTWKSLMSRSDVYACRGCVRRAFSLIARRSCVGPRA
jgi:DNA-binding transcriptional LysR family regulator